MAALPVRNNYLASRVDKNQPAVVSAFRKLGYFVKHCHETPHFVDILVIKSGFVGFVEIKDGQKPPSARKLTNGEQGFKDAMDVYGGNWFLVKDLDDVLEVDRFYKERQA